jgi:opacity protein-like surface antigen
MRTLNFVFFVLLINSSFLFADESQYIQFIRKYQTAHILEQGKTEISLTGGAVNSTLDIFNFKNRIASSENLDISQFSNFGDWQSYGVNINIGLAKRVMARINYGYDLLEIGRSNAKIQSYGFEVKTTLVEESEVLPTISFSLRYDTHIANNIKGDINAISLTLDDVNITRTFSPPETLTVGGLNDQNIHLGIHYGKLINENLMLYSFQKFIHTEVSSEFSTSLPLGQFQKLKDDFSYHSNAFNAGLGVYYHIGTSWLLTSEYQFYYFKRKFNGTPYSGNNNNKAHTLDIALHYFVTENCGLTLGGSIDSSFLAGEIPLTFNKKSASKFDNPYGQLYLSVTFGFDITK